MCGGEIRVDEANMSVLSFRATAQMSLHCKQSGFTLIEMLVTLSIFSFILVALYSTFFVSKKAIDAVEGSLLRIQESRSLLDIIKREIESSYFDKGKTYTVFKLDDRDFFGKQASRIFFTGFSPVVPGLARIEYVVEEGDTGLVLRKKISSAHAPPAEVESTELMEDIESFNVEVKLNNEWVRTWNSELSGTAPEEVRITISFMPKGTASQGVSSQLYTLSDLAMIYTGKTI